MYDRRYHGKVLAFEASGGLLNAALVMRDRETDSWWSIMTGDAIGGELDGTRLKELTVGEKAQWRDWKRRYPRTKVLSVKGKQHVDQDPYESYYSSKDGFRGLSTPDTRLQNKEAVYAFQMNGIAYAVPHSAIEGGKVFDVGHTTEVFLYRESGSDMLASTIAYVSEKGGESSRFDKRKGRWRDLLTGSEFSKDIGFRAQQVDQQADESVQQLQRLDGFDTFWYTWSTTHQGVTIIE